MTKKSTKSQPAPLQRYFLPDYGISVLAESIEAAIAQAEKLNSKQESGDGE